MIAHLVIALSVFFAQPTIYNEIQPKATPLASLQTSQDMRITKDIRYVRRPWTRKKMTSLDVYQPAPQSSPSSTTRPILIFIHGGGWAIGDKSRIQHKAQWATDLGMVFVSINYRLSPRVQHPEHAKDCAEAIAFVIDNASDWNADPDRIIIMGHSAGAHLAAIVATDETLLGKHGLTGSDLMGVILLDGAGYDIPAQMASPNLKGIARRMYESAFGEDADLWVAASPTLQAKPNDQLPPMLAIHVGDRERSRTESTKLVKAWNATGAKAILHHAPTKDHAAINKELGMPNDPDTEAVERFMATILDR